MNFVCASLLSERACRFCRLLVINVIAPDRKSNNSHSRFQGTVNEILLNSLDILTFVVPPILPAALTANNAFAQKRLQKKGIFCLHSKHICLCGGIDIVAFDKVICLSCLAVKRKP